MKIKSAKLKTILILNGKEIEIKCSCLTQYLTETNSDVTFEGENDVVEFVKADLIP